MSRIETATNLENIQDNTMVCISSLCLSVFSPTTTECDITINVLKYIQGTKSIYNCKDKIRLPQRNISLTLILTVIIK